MALVLVRRALAAVSAALVLVLRLPAAVSAALAALAVLAGPRVLAARVGMAG